MPNYSDETIADALDGIQRRRYVLPAIQREFVWGTDRICALFSLLIQEGRRVVDVARQAGHSPTMPLDVYRHVFDEFDPADRIPADDQIRRARGTDVCPKSVRRPRPPSQQTRKPCKPSEPHRFPQDLPHDLVRPTANGPEPGIPRHALDLVLLHVAGAAVDL
jgi:hypothetical protein